jgi:DNA-binding response OmpR family regulator
MRVLLIEDDSATAQSIELMLKSESFNVYTTDLGEEGVDLGSEKGARLSRPSEVVLEILPGPQRGFFAKEDGEVVINEKGECVGRQA